MHEDVGAVGAVETGLDLAASEVVQDCCQGIEAPRGIVSEEEKRIERGEVIKRLK
jgi:hypothetical protein